MYTIALGMGLSPPLPVIPITTAFQPAPRVGVGGIPPHCTWRRPLGTGAVGHRRLAWALRWPVLYLLRRVPGLRPCSAPSAVRSTRGTRTSVCPCPASLLPLRAASPLFDAIAHVTITTCALTSLRLSAPFLFWPCPLLSGATATPSASAARWLDPFQVTPSG